MDFTALNTALGDLNTAANDLAARAKNLPVPTPVDVTTQVQVIVQITELLKTVLVPVV